MAPELGVRYRAYFRLGTQSLIKSVTVHALIRITLDGTLSMGTAATDGNLPALSKGEEGRGKRKDSKGRYRGRQFSLATKQRLVSLTTKTNLIGSFDYCLAHRESSIGLWTDSSLMTL